MKSKDTKVPSLQKNGFLYNPTSIVSSQKSVTKNVPSFSKSQHSSVHIAVYK